MSSPSEWYSRAYAKEWTQCARKQLITSKEEANVRARAMQEKYRQVFNSYQCPFCGGFHVGRIGPAKEKRYLQNRVKQLNNAFQILTPRWMEDWTRVL
jgi:hypothetical protein